MDAGVVVSLLASVCIPLIIAYVTRRKLTAETNKNNAEAADHVTDAAISLIKPLKEELEHSHQELTSMKAQVEILSRGIKDLTNENGRLKIQIEILIEQVKKLGGDPCYLPQLGGQGDIYGR